MKKYIILMMLIFVACTGGSVAYEQAPDPVIEPIQIPSSVPDENETNEIDEVDDIDEIISHMHIREKIGQLFVVRMPPNMQQAEMLIENQAIGGFVFFGSDVTTVEDMQDRIGWLQYQSSVPLFIAVDEEGGRVSRVGRLFPEAIGSPFSVGLLGDPQNAYNMYQEIGNRLVYLGFNMNFAPVADIWTNPQNAVIGDRSFGTEPELVADMVAEAVRGLQSTGILSVIKHFPGHGDTVEDSHFLRAFYHHDRARFNEVEAIPFISGIEAGARGVMMGHITTPLLTPDTPTQTSVFSEYLIQAVLRQEMGFSGLIITDALDMRAVTDYYTEEEIMLNAFLAGADILLMPRNPITAHQIMYEAYQNGLFTTERLHESLRRILQAKYSL